MTLRELQKQALQLPINERWQLVQKKVGIATTRNFSCEEKRQFIPFGGYKLINHNAA